MNVPRYAFGILAPFTLAVATLPLAAQPVNHHVTGNLTVDGTSSFTDDVFINNLYSNGNLDIEGYTWLNGAYFGEFYPDEYTIVQAFEILAGNTGTEFHNYAGSSYFSWWDDAYEGAKFKMRLDEDNALQLYHPTTELPGVILSPDDDSWFANNVVMDGTDNIMPNQTPDSEYSVITRKLGDARYVRPLGQIEFVDVESSGVRDSLLLGRGNYLNGGSYSWLIGENHNSSGIGNSALGAGNHLDGNNGVALGHGNGVQHWHSRALGAFGYVGGFGATSLGWNNHAFGDNSLAGGSNTIARAANVTVFGRLNREGGSSVWQWDDRLFVLGNGERSDATGNPFGTHADYADPSFTPYWWLNNLPHARRSDAFVVHKDGATEIIAHREADANSNILSVMDGSDDPETPDTVFAVDKEGDVSTVGEIASTGPIQVGEGHDHTPVTGEAKPSYLGTHGFNDEATEEEAPVLVVGGGDETTNANSMVVRKDGTVEVGKTLRVPPAGDLAMGDFTAGVNPATVLRPTAP
jgi:hypothetical protein